MKHFTRLFIITIILATIQDNIAFSQNKFNFGLSSPVYFGTARFGNYLEMANELQGHTGNDALKFNPGTGFGIFGELEFSKKWTFDIYWQKYANKTNFGKSNVDAFTPSASGSATSQYKMSHSIIGIGASRKTFQVKGQQIWIFSALSAGSRKFAWRAENGDFSNERHTTNRLFIGSSEAPMFFNLGLSAKLNFANKFFFSPRIGYEMELMKGDGKAFGDGLPELVQASYSVNTPQSDIQAIVKEYADGNKANLNRIFIEFRAGIKLGK